MIEIFVQSRYVVDRKKLRARVESFLKRVGVDPTIYTVSVAIVGDRKMAQVHTKFMQKSGTTPVLAFPLLQGKPHAANTIDKKYGTNVLGIAMKEEPTLLGEIVISYPQTIIFASEENKLVDTKLGEFAEHGLTNLLKN